MLAVTLHRAGGLIPVVCPEARHHNDIRQSLRCLHQSVYIRLIILKPVIPPMFLEVVGQRSHWIGHQHDLSLGKRLADLRDHGLHGGNGLRWIVPTGGRAGHRDVIVEPTLNEYPLDPAVLAAVVLDGLLQLPGEDGVRSGKIPSDVSAPGHGVIGFLGIVHMREPRSPTLA